MFFGAGGTRLTADMPLNDDICWAAVCKRDRSFDGQFVTGVFSTGIYCRPSCSARHPARRNVKFFANGVAARNAGLRSCLRCLPDEASREDVAIEAALTLMAGEAPPKLADLAEAVGYAPAHFLRMFKRRFGVTPAVWVRLAKLRIAEQAIADGETVTDAIYIAGYSAPSRFYADKKKYR